REPVGVRVASELFGPTAVRAHAPDLHLSTTERVVVDELSAGCVVGAVIEAGAGGQASLLSAAHRTGIDVPFAIAAPDERQRLSVGRPSMPEARRLRRNLHRRRSAEAGEDVDAGREPVLLWVRDVLVCGV